jgi:hypothetical protein
MGHQVLGWALITPGVYSSTVCVLVLVLVHTYSYCGHTVRASADKGIGPAVTHGIDHLCARATAPQRPAQGCYCTSTVRVQILGTVWEQCILYAPLL